MKKILLLSLMLAVVWGLNAQQIIFENLPGAVQAELTAEDHELDNEILEDEFEMKSDQSYYQGNTRTLSTDTIIYYRWYYETEEWFQTHRKVKTYNDDELLIAVLFQHWNPMEEGWFNGVYKDFVY
ncbi:MAG: hypothetical protein KAG99_02275, partial [Bacteroidales bacterium]|nr:hypothetical protein [Bacteroidales bacterium]